MGEAVPGEVRCLECDTVLAEGAPNVKTDDGVFCVDCFERLKQQVQRAIAVQSQDIDLPRALVGAVGGGMLGAALWWGITVATNVRLGLIAVVIGIAVGKGIVTLTGGKRARALQVLSVVVSVLAYAAGTYLTNRTFILRYLATHGKAMDLPLVPEDPALFFRVATAAASPFDLLFLAFLVHQAWKIPAPLRLPD